jgi:membrane-bound ClpP family serine protease
MEVFRDLPGPSLDLILHSPGGSAEAADRLVRYMRSKYSDVRVIIPLAAMSAATMWALGGDRIVMGKHSQLGPIDPQVPIANNYVPASALVRQFQRISDECAADPARLSAWLPTLQQYWPGLLEICNDADELGRSMVEQWVASYMLRDKPNADVTAKQVANFFADAGRHKSHSKAIDRDEARAQGVEILNLEDDEALQDAVLSVHHAFMITLQGPALKLIENSLGRTFVVSQVTQVTQVTQMVQLPAQSFMPPQLPALPPGV